MQKRLYIILGNGFSIDLINRMDCKEKIDLTNLFNFGYEVKWLSDEEPGFLSYKRCPNLWNLGARFNKGGGTKLIEEIITCANVYSYVKLKNPKRILQEDGIYIKAYKELVEYLKFLFIHYNDLISDEELNLVIQDWGWKYLFEKFKDVPEKFEKVTIVTYNYDIWLERVLELLGIQYSFPGIKENDSAIVDIIKPHGSISFQSDRCLDNSSFEIHYGRDILEGRLGDIKIESKNLRVNSRINAMIPPAGDSARFSNHWSNELQSIAREAAKKLIEKDEVLLCGLSYWNVDRLELDELFLDLDADVNLKVINPNLPSEFNAVLESLFTNYVVYANSDILGGLYE